MVNFGTNAIIIFVNRQKKAIIFSCPLLAILLSIGCIGCVSNISYTTSIPQATSESRMADGFSFSVSVSDTHPRLGEQVIINTELQNISNTGLVLDDMGGMTSIQITNEAGQLVWGIGIGRTGTTLNTPISLAWNFGGPRTWTVDKDPNYTVAVTAGIYTLSVSDSGFFDPALNMDVPFSVTPIQIVVD